jgi:hypothetical protein
MAMMWLWRRGVELVAEAAVRVEVLAEGFVEAVVGGPARGIRMEFPVDGE